MSLVKGKKGNGRKLFFKMNKEGERENLPASNKGEKGEGGRGKERERLHKEKGGRKEGKGGEKGAPALLSGDNEERGRKRSRKKTKEGKKK